jgi:hypothetical protein
VTVQGMGYFWIGTSKLDDWSILSALRQKIVGQIGEDLECTRQPVLLLAQNDFVATSEDISTSLPLSRNSFGKRTAWLLPDQNTRALAMPISPSDQPLPTLFRKLLSAPTCFCSPAKSSAICS